MLEEKDFIAQKIREQFTKKRIPLGTIRLEEGEELTINNRKWIRSKEYGNSNGFSKTTEGRSLFNINIDYDNFTASENLEIIYYQNKWLETRSGGGLNYEGSMWPIEGPATVKVDIRPGFYSVQKYDNTSGKRYHKCLNPEQYCRISFKKNLASYRASQNQLQALVLPTGVQGMSVIMESSEDLVNWTRDTLGPKATADRPKFFRLRAVKE